MSLIYITPQDDGGEESSGYIILHGTVDFAGSVADLSQNAYFNQAGTFSLYDVADCSSVANVAAMTFLLWPGRSVVGTAFRAGPGNRYVCVTLA